MVRIPTCHMGDWVLIPCLRTFNILNFKQSIYIKNKLSVDLWIVDQVTSPEKTGSGDVKTEKTKKRQKLQKKLKTNKKNKKAKKLKKLKKGKNYKKKLKTNKKAKKLKKLKKRQKLQKKTKN